MFFSYLIRSFTHSWSFSLLVGRCRQTTQLAENSDADGPPAIRAETRERAQNVDLCCCKREENHFQGRSCLCLCVYVYNYHGHRLYWRQSEAQTRSHGYNVNGQVEVKVRWKEGLWRRYSRQQLSFGKLWVQRSMSVCFRHNLGMYFSWFFILKSFIEIQSSFSWIFRVAVNV